MHVKSVLQTVKYFVNVGYCHELKELSGTAIWPVLMSLKPHALCMAGAESSAGRGRVVSCYFIDSRYSVRVSAYAAEGLAISGRLSYNLTSFPASYPLEHLGARDKRSSGTGLHT